MRKIFLATTVLVASTSFAFADLSLSGDAKFGLKYDSSNTDEIAIHSKVAIKFKASGETDGGLGWGAEVKMEKKGGGTGKIKSEKVWISGSWGKLTFGSVNSGDKKVVGQIDGDGDVPYIADKTKDAMAIYHYESNGFEFAASTSQFGAGPETFGIGIGYEQKDKWSIALGYGDDGPDNQVTLKGSLTFNKTTLTAIYQNQKSESDDAYGISAKTEFDNIELAVFAIRAHDTKVDYGMEIEYDLGGKATLYGELARDNDPVSADSKTTAEIGFKVKF